MSVSSHLSVWKRPEGGGGTFQKAQPQLTDEGRGGSSNFSPGAQAPKLPGLPAGGSSASTRPPCQHPLAQGLQLPAQALSSQPPVSWGSLELAPHGTPPPPPPPPPLLTRCLGGAGPTLTPQLERSPQALGPWPHIPGEQALQAVSFVHGNFPLWVCIVPP